MSDRANITLHIERLVLDGIALGPGDERRLQAAAQAELARLLAEGGLAEGLRSRAALPALAVGDLTTGGDTAGMGREIARAIYDGIGARRGGER